MISKIAGVNFIDVPRGLLFAGGSVFNHRFDAFEAGEN